MRCLPVSFPIAIPVHTQSSYDYHLGKMAVFFLHGVKKVGAMTDPELAREDSKMVAKRGFNHTLFDM